MTNNTLIQNGGSILLSDYAVKIADTDILDHTDIKPILLGLYGEVGGIMSTAKKLIRENIAYPRHKKEAEEEFGDTLWYLAALCRRLDIPLDELFCEATRPTSDFKMLGVANDLTRGGFAQVAVPILTDSPDATLFKLGRSAGALLEDTPKRTAIACFARDYLHALSAANLKFSDVVHGNLHKTRGAFLDPCQEDLIDFDADFGIEEQLPRKFQIRLNQRGSARSYLQWQGVFIGDPLTDNMSDRDGYRFHDVFHFAYAAILHWSPVTRALIKHKRKSIAAYDEEQDSGRAIVVEEGVTAWIFSRAKELHFFENQKKISLEMLKTIAEFVSGYEVEKCPLKLWEKAILEGYSVFRQIKDAEGGWIIGDRELRTIRYEAFESQK
ncbi:pyrophosphatase [Undibacterium sp. YM2]|uniref:nucleoside triphosphate pyrophosphohydrolase family protein n=1 Tax=Undibacterium sp. YM2 TaxID=2058625 RepID=UPI001331F857|nr:nucleoside triphosphate pyrophosphohydrolase family protein [Undibacterium sp. YM2]BBB65519.1 pyrophosphatase [Undibacterium sp. YM2]